jgi:hypothetical protein
MLQTLSPNTLLMKTDGIRTGCGVRCRVIDVLEPQIKRRPTMKTSSTAAARESRNVSQQKLTIGLDLGDRWSWYFVLDESGVVWSSRNLARVRKPWEKCSARYRVVEFAVETGPGSPCRFRFHQSHFSQRKSLSAQVSAKGRREPGAPGFRLKSAIVDAIRRLQLLLGERVSGQSS